MTWFLSLSLWFIVFFLLGISFDIMTWGWFGLLDSNMLLVWLIFISIFTLILKKIFFSANFIQSRLEVFARWVEDISSSAWDIPTPAQTTHDHWVPDTIQTPSITVHQEEEKPQDTVPTEWVIENKASTSGIVMEYEEIYEPSPLDVTLDNWWKAIKVFFSENLLAKLWAILIFLWVLFFLNLIYNQVWDVAKMIIGLSAGLSVYGLWIWLDTKWYTNESRILMWLGILINYLVILSGRYILGEAWILSEWLTFAFLILNTIFAIATSLVYQSSTLLLFAFVVAYLNPLLVGASSETPYTLVGYTLIISVGALFMSAKNKSIILFVLSLIFGNILIFAAPESILNQGIFKLVWFNMLYLISLWAGIQFSDKYKTVLEILFAGWFFVLGMFIFWNFSYFTELPYTITALISGFILMIGWYLLSFKKPYLYSIATAGGVLTLWSVIVISGWDMFRGYGYDNWAFLLTSISSIIVFAFSHWIVPFIHPTLMSDKKHINSFLIGNITGVLFLGFMLYMFGGLFFPGLILGFAFLSLALCYAIYLFLCIQKLDIDVIKQDTSLQNIVFAIIGIIVSLVAIAVAFIFSKYPEIIGTLWLFEATLLFYFFSRVKSWKLYIAGIVLFIIGILKFVGLLDIVQSWDFMLLISLTIVFISLVLNIRFISPKVTQQVDGYDLWHSILHLLSIWVFAGLLLIIIPSTGHGWSILWIGLFVWVLAGIYGYCSSRVLKYTYLVIFIGFAMLQIGAFDSTMWKIDHNEKEYLRVLQYATSGILVLGYWLYKKYNSLSHLSVILGALLWGYLFIITTMYVEDIFNSLFAITIYWGLLAFIFLMHGISKDIIKIRTLGLYIMMLTAGKIFLYDIWYNFDDAISRVVALIFVWILMMIISTRYTKKYGNNLTGEFNIRNLMKK